MIKPALLEIWGDQARKTVNKKAMMATQRPCLLAAVKAYQTTSSAVQVLNGAPPWWLEVQVQFEESARNRLDLHKEKLRVAKVVALPRKVEILRMNGNFTVQN